MLVFRKLTVKGFGLLTLLMTHCFEGELGFFEVVVEAQQVLDVRQRQVDVSYV